MSLGNVLHEAEANSGPFGFSAKFIAEAVKAFKDSETFCFRNFRALIGNLE